MRSFTLRPSLGTIQSIATLERFAGRWESLSSSETSASARAMEKAIRLGSEASLRLDATSPAGLDTLQKLDTGEENTEALQTLANTMGGHLSDFELSMNGILRLNQIVVGNELAVSANAFRDTPLSFSVPGNYRLFDAPAAFLVESRLKDLLAWGSDELSDTFTHPLYIIGTFYLVFLQIQPFPTGNHRTAIVLTWHLLKAHGFEHLQFSHFAEKFESRQSEYFTALRQAEKTTNGNWSTLNVWLEFFLEVLVESNDAIHDARNKLIAEYRLTSVQEKIVSAIKTNGALTRDKIVRVTGINVSTVKYNLAVLKKRGLLKRAGGGRSTSYSVE